jgi:serine/threonine protein kinase
LDDEWPEFPLKGGARAADAVPVVRIGDVLLGRFRLQRIIGRGGMGLVFAASDLQMQGEPQIAIKLLNEDMREFPVAAMALERECRKVRMLGHENIVRVFEFYRSGEQTFITMELLEGESLDVSIKRFPDGIPAEDAWRIIRGCAGALAYAHRQDPPFVHSDFKPSNVFVTRSGQVKVLDFGVARAARTPDARTTNLSIFDPAQYGALTPAYASAEMLAGLNSDPRDDIYALACVSYEILRGKHPFERRPADQARSLMLRPSPIPGVGARVNKALAHGLAVDRTSRTGSAVQFIQELGDPPEPPELHRRRLRLGLVTAAAFTLALGLWRLISMIYLPHPATAIVAVPDAKPAPVLSDKRADPRSPNRANTTAATVSAEKAAALLQLLGLPASQVPPSDPYPASQLRMLIETSPRRVALGSSPEQIQAALSLCQQYSSGCQLSWYAEEKLRTVTLEPYELDPTPVSVREFRRFANATQYKTDAENAGVAYALIGESLQPINGGNWRNGIKQYPVTEDSPVVGMTFRDAQEYCRWKKQRLPTEDEWEYIARGPERHNFPWGDDVAPAVQPVSTPPRIGEGLAEGIGYRYRGLSGNVWQWVDTTNANGAKVLKGGSWLEQNPANRRAAVQRMEQPSRADADSGFRCARSAPTWPDADVWLARASALAGRSPD